MGGFLVVSAALLGLTLVPELATAQGGVGRIPAGNTPTISEEDAARPAPKLHDGKPDLSGPWIGGGSRRDLERDAGFEPGELPLLPWARELRETRREQDEPYTACLPMSVPKVNPYPWRIVQSYTEKGMTHIFLLHETGDSGGHRQIFVDGRQHPDPDNLFPTWLGHSIGQWDGDTLVIDTVGYNDKAWLDAQGTPRTEQLHTIERYSRPNYGTLINEFTLDDPGAFSRIVSMTFRATHIRPDLDLMEFICQEGNEYGAAAGFQPGLGTSIK